MPLIDEYEEIRLVNSKGETVELNSDQLLYLAKLCSEKAGDIGGDQLAEQALGGMTRGEIGHEMLKRMGLGGGLSKEQQA